MNVYTLLAIVIMGVLNVLSFYIGAKVGQTVVRGEKIETPVIDPLKAYREREARKETEYEQNRVNTILDNIDNYDGTAAGQKEVPRG